MLFPLAPFGAALCGFLFHFFHVRGESSGIASIEKSWESVVVALLHEGPEAGLQATLNGLMCRVIGEIDQAVRIALNIVELFHCPVIHGRKTGGDFLVGRCHLFHQAIGGGSVGCSLENIGAV